MRRKNSDLPFQVPVNVENTDIPYVTQLALIHNLRIVHFL